MADIDDILVRLKSENPVKRYDACEDLRVSPSLPGEALLALEKSVGDMDPLVADAAQRALDLHTIKIEPQELDAIQSEEIKRQTPDVTKLYKNIRSWAISLLVWGGLSLVAGGMLDPIWGLMLIALGIISFRIKIPSIFLIYCVILAGASITNLFAALSGGGAWFLLLGAVFIQVVASIRTYADYRKFRQLPLKEIYEAGHWPENTPKPQDEARILNIFAVASFILGIISISMLSLFFLTIFILALLPEFNYESTLILDWIALGAVGLAWFGVGFSLSAIISGNDRKMWAIAGIIISGLVLLVEIGLSTLMLITG